MEVVSLIIPVYNKEPFLVRCFNSIAIQNTTGVQVIVIDDGSTDGSKKICKEYCNENGWEFYGLKHQGVSYARNYGIEMAKGKYIAFLDADDSLNDGILSDLAKITRHGYNIFQFGQRRYQGGEESFNRIYCAPKGHYNLEHIPKYWVHIWNKLYKKSFLNQHKIKFDEKLPFGEDEIFNARCILANGGLYHAPQIMTNHFLDDKNSICRGSLCLEYLEGLDNALEKLANKQKDPLKKNWLNKVRERHHRSNTFLRYGWKRKASGKYDIVYFLKQSPTNEELRYSLRSVEKNWQYNEVWFYGGCPEGLKPDHYVLVSQIAPSKYQRVRDMLYQACLNDEITEDFWLFNDDFFVLKPKSENMPAQYNRTLEDRIEKIEKRHGGVADDYTNRLRHLVKTLKSASKPTLDYAVHKPMLINRKRMLEVLDKFPDEPMSRALYGNYWKIGGVSKHDMKIRVLNYGKMPMVMKEWDFLSTSDSSFESGNVGKYLKDKFKEKSRFEI